LKEEKIFLEDFLLQIFSEKKMKKIFPPKNLFKSPRSSPKNNLPEKRNHLNFLLLLILKKFSNGNFLGIRFSEKNSLFKKPR